MSDRSLPALLASMAIAATVHPVFAATVVGGGSSTSDCAVVLEIPGANKPALPKAPKAVDCVDGDAACDGDGLRNGECVFPLQLCVNSTALAGCTPDQVTGITVGARRRRRHRHPLRHRLPGPAVAGRRPRPADLLRRTTARCRVPITVRLRGPDSSSRMKTEPQDPARSPAAPSSRPAR